MHQPRRLAGLAVLFLAATCAGAAAAGTITVCADGGQYTTIQAAVNAATPGDEVVVCPGTYTGPGNRDISFGGKAITVRGAAGPEATIIDCQSAGRGFVFDSGETAASVLADVTITSGNVATGSLFGGAVLCDNTSPTISNCIIRANRADGGGGISCQNGGSPKILNCRVTGNVANGGGGIRCFGSHPIIRNCVISGNNANSAAGVYCYASSATITDCVLSGNSASSAGAIYAYLGNVVIANDVICGNSAYSGPGVYCSTNAVAIVNCVISGNAAIGYGAGIRIYNASPQVTNCTIVANAAGYAGGGTYCDGTSNPVFANSILWGDSPQEAYAAAGSITFASCDVQGGAAGFRNIDAQPLFPPATGGTCTGAGSYDAATHTVTIPDANAAWTAGALVGRLLRPNGGVALRLPIVANTATTVTIPADWDTIRTGVSSVSAGTTYEIHDPRPGAASPCINAGANGALPFDAADLDGNGDAAEPIPTDLDRRPRVRRGVVDIGAYEFQRPPPRGTPADRNDDGDVDLEDFGLFAACFNGPNLPAAQADCNDGDFDRDADVDLDDFTRFAACFNGPNRLPPATVNYTSKLFATGAADYSESGRTVSISGDYAVSGAHFDYGVGRYSGSAYVFRRDGTGWVPDAKLTASDAAAFDRFGEAVSICGDAIVVGAHYDDAGGVGAQAGSAYVFRRTGSGWTQEAHLKASGASAGDQFGIAVAISGHYAVVGSDVHNTVGSYSGAACVFRRTSAGWVQAASLIPAGLSAGDYFGHAVSIYDDRILVGAYGDDDGAPNAGAAYVFRRDGAAWAQEAQLVASDAGDTDGFGLSVCLHGDYAIVGAPWDDDGGSNSGSAYIFHRDGTSWTPMAKVTASDAAAWDMFGHAVAIDGDYSVIGAWNRNGPGTAAGAAYVYRRRGTSWVELARLKAFDADNLDHYGQAVSISGRSFLIGCPYDDETAPNAGSAYAYDILSSCASWP